MKSKVKIFVVPVLLVLLFLFPLLSFAEKATQKISIKVEGLYCPFCAYGIEKQLKKLKGFKKVEINLKHGVAELHVKPGMSITDQAIQQAVEDAGFDSATIERTQNGDKQ